MRLSSSTEDGFDPRLIESNEALEGPVYTPGRSHEREDSMRPSDTPPVQAGLATASLDVRLFGPLGDAFGHTVRVAFPTEQICVADLRRLLATTLGPAGEKVLSASVRICIDKVIAAEGARIRPGQEVAVLPVFSGG